jgi:hypothetical protein
LKIGIWNFKNRFLSLRRKPVFINSYLKGTPAHGALEIWLLGFICHLKIGIWEFQKPVSIFTMGAGLFYYQTSFKT